MPYSIKEDDIGYCSLCAAEKRKPKGPTVNVIVADSQGIDSLSFCEDHLLEVSEEFQKIKGVKE